MLSSKPASRQHWKSSPQPSQSVNRDQTRAYTFEKNHRCALALSPAIRQSAIRNPQSVNGQHPGHSTPNQIDSQYRADHQGDANGGGVKNAQSPAACPGWPSVCGVDEQGAGFAATADRSQTSSFAASARSKNGAGRCFQLRQGLACALNTNLLLDAARFDEQ